MLKKKHLNGSVQEKTSFICYEGDLDIFQDEMFDIVFTKSVLVLIPNLETFLLKISTKLKPGGKIVFLENAFGNPFFQALRYCKHPNWNFKKFSYFTKKEICIIKKTFKVSLIKKSRMQPVFLICGYKSSL